MNIFDIMGPVMVGPSSSHTAGAVRIGLITRHLLGSQPGSARLLLHGSFAATGKGHGTDRALVAGLLGMAPDDPRIPRAFALAREAGMELHISTAVLRGAHPNTVLLQVRDAQGREMEVNAMQSSPHSNRHPRMRTSRHPQQWIPSLFGIRMLFRT